MVMQNLRDAQYLELGEENILTGLTWIYQPAGSVEEVYRSAIRHRS